MDNPDYIEVQIGLIQDELKKDIPNTFNLRQSARRINEWIDEINLAMERRKAKMGKVI